jgi:hypothetical protein
LLRPGQDLAHLLDQLLSRAHRHVLYAHQLFQEGAKSLQLLGGETTLVPHEPDAEPAQELPKLLLGQKLVAAATGHKQQEHHQEQS